VPDHPTEVKLTDSGRQVTGGGGIAPDISVPAPKLTKFEQLLYRSDVFYPAETGVGGFTRYYLGMKPAITKDFEVDDNVMRTFREYLSKHTVRYTEPEMAERAIGLRGRSNKKSSCPASASRKDSKCCSESDPQVQKAVDAIPEARALYQTAKRITAQRTGGAADHP